jgi:hypothetical protein
MPGLRAGQFVLGVIPKSGYRISDTITPEES